MKKSTLKKIFGAMLSVLGFGSLMSSCSPWVCMYMAPKGEWQGGEGEVRVMYGPPENIPEDPEESEETDPSDSPEASPETPDPTEDYGIPEED